MIDFHTHQKTIEENETSIYCSTHNQLETPKSMFFCLGYHPWFLDEKPDLALLEKKLNKYIDHPSFFSIGEIGLDKIKPISFEIQIKYFQAQIELAIKHKIKTIVLHSVRAFNEIYQILDETKYSGNLLFHDFRGHNQIFEQFNKKWKTYISLSYKALDNPKRAEQIKNIPVEYILIESDENSPKYLEKAIETQSSIFNITSAEIKNYQSLAFNILKQN